MQKTIAFVFSGGGNYGALQVGALRALVEHQIVPQLIFGSSAGAINAAYFAAHPTLAGVEQLGTLWREVTGDNVYPGTHWHTLWRVLTRRESLYPNDALHQFLTRRLPPHAVHFRDIHPLRLFITTAHLDTNDLHLYGEDPEDSILEAVMASTALPPFSPPWRGADGRLHVDGGSVSNLPLGMAVKHGATDIYALQVTETPAVTERMRAQIRTMADIGYSTMQTLLKYQLEAELSFAKAQPHVTLHYLILRGPHGLSFRDFSHSSEMIASGYEQARQYLALHTAPPVAPTTWTTRWHSWGRILVDQYWRTQQRLSAPTTKRQA